MIGIFDSGSGGLTFLAAMKYRHPEWSYIYYADYDNCPYGEKTPEEIQMLTIAWVQKLFDAGATIVILACNTASAWTLHKLQTEIFPDKKILGVTIPGAEKVVELGVKNVTVFATAQTVKSRTYSERVRILDHNTKVNEIAFSGDLVREIEELLPIKKCHNEEDFLSLFSLYSPAWWHCEGPEWQALAMKYMGELDLSKYGHEMEGIILWCTHYSYLFMSLKYIFPGSIIIDPSEESARKLDIYFSKNIPIFSQIQKTGWIKFL